MRRTTPHVAPLVRGADGAARRPYLVSAHRDSGRRSEVRCQAMFQSAVRPTRRYFFTRWQSTPPACGCRDGLRLESNQVFPLAKGHPLDDYCTMRSLIRRSLVMGLVAVSCLGAGSARAVGPEVRDDAGLFSSTAVKQ